MFGKIKKLHFVGIGGAGMSGIAEILTNLDYKITGSDNTPSEITEYLEKIGIKVYDNHSASNLKDVDVLVISSAVGEDNSEVIEARRLGLPVIKRAEMLGELMRLKFSIGVSGTHGKTTTTSMIGKILQHGNYQPTLIVGGVVAELGTGASLGTGQYLVAEADEYDKSFLSMFPTVAVVTNLEADHLDCYDDIDDLKNSFLTYMNRVPFFGTVVISADDENLKLLKHKITRPYKTFGFDEEADYRAAEITISDGKTSFSIYQNENLLGTITLQIPGRFNVLNALAAVSTSVELEVPFDTIKEGLQNFTGVGRRFEIIGEIDDIILVDDYAHHPTEIEATLKTAQEVYDRRIIVIYQPHLYSRTRDFKDRFAQSLSIADISLLVDIYPAREEPIEGITSAVIAEEGNKLSSGSFEYLGAKENAIDKVVSIAQPGDMIITMGAGSITLIKNRIMEALKNR
jgi:UDP-N-acetylmuramate--alanine ligase